LDHIVAVAILREEGEVWREGKWEEGNRGGWEIEELRKQ
jgi:hypothetical protein